MPDLHQKTTAAVAELRRLAEAGGERDWEAQLPTLHMDGSTAGRIVPIGGAPAVVLGQFAPGVAALIVAAVNTLRRAIPAWEEVLNRHRPRVCPLGHVESGDHIVCAGHSVEIDIDRCVELRSLARAVGVLEEE